jgi:hypothetical protein
MAFKLRSQSPLMQGAKTGFNNPDEKFTKNIQSSLVASNNKVNKIKANKKANPSPNGIVSRMYDDLDAAHPLEKAAIQIMDPTGTSSYRDVKKAWNDGKFNSSDIIEPIGAIPVIGKFGKSVINLSKAVRGARVFKEAKASKAIRGTRKASDVQTGVNAVASSPIRQQKLSPKAAKAKAERDLRYAKTDDRRIKKAHSQRMHRKNPGNKDKDYDHKDGRFESVKQNRGNDGEGTKKESGKKYKITNTKK